MYLGGWPTSLRSPSMEWYTVRCVDDHQWAVKIVGVTLNGIEILYETEGSGKIDQAVVDTGMCHTILAT